MARILVVEDEPLISMLLADWLVELGHEVLGPAETVGEALRLIDETNPTAAILDVNLHDQRCDDIAEKLAARSIPMAFATGSHVETAPAKFGDVLTIMKPYDFAAVERMLVSLTSLSR